MMCYTGSCKWEQTSGPDTGDCTWRGWYHEDKAVNPPCPQVEKPRQEENKMKTLYGIWIIWGRDINVNPGWHYTSWGVWFTERKDVALAQLQISKRDYGDLAQLTVRKLGRNGLPQN